MILNVPLSALVRFVLLNGQWLVLNLLGTPVPSAHQLGVGYLWLLIGSFMGLVWIVFQARRVFREFRGFLQLRRMTSQERSTFALQKFLRVSFPLWLSPTIAYEPTLEELEAILHERERALTSRRRAITEEDNVEEEAHEAPLSIYKRLLLTDCLLLTLQKPDGGQFMLPLNDAAASLIGFLATRKPGEWTNKKDLFRQQIYQSGQDAVFTQHRLRTNDYIMKRAREKGFLQGPIKDQKWEDAPSDEPENTTLVQEEGNAGNIIVEKPTQDETNAEEEIKLFENELQGNGSFWRLSSQYHVEIFPVLTALFQKVTRAETLPEPSAFLSLEELREGCYRLMDEYGIGSDRVGFLAQHIKPGSDPWHWAIPFYRQYQRQCLAILSHALWREHEYLYTLDEGEESHAVLAWIAQLYGWSAIVAVGLDLKDRGIQSEKDMVECLSYYRQIRKRADARAIYQRYCQFRSWIDPSYQPEPALKKCAEAILYPQKRRS